MRKKPLYELGTLKIHSMLFETTILHKMALFYTFKVMVFDVIESSGNSWVTSSSAFRLLVSESHVAPGNFENEETNV